MEDRVMPNYEEYYKDKVRENEKLKEENEDLKKYIFILLEILKKDYGKKWQENDNVLKIINGDR